MAQALLTPPFVHFDLPPTEDELPSDDGVPVETLRHRL